MTCVLKTGLVTPMGIVVGTFLTSAGEIIHIDNIKRVAIKPFDIEERTMASLSGIIDGSYDVRYMYFITSDNIEHKVDLQDRYNSISTDSFMPNDIGRRVTVPTHIKIINTILGS